MFNNQILAGAAGQGGSFYPYSIDQSLRFNDDDSAYLSRTPASAGNRKTWTWSAWVKRSSIDSTNAYILFDASTSDTAAALLEFGKSTEGDNSFNVVSYQGSHNIRLRTSMRFRDVSSWYHIVVAMDTTQATDSDRVNIYVNGTLQTDFQIETYPAQNHEPYFNSTNQHHISKWWDSRRFFDGYMAEVNFIDGTALDASSFGETSNGVWVPKSYSGSYGTNGFYLSFADSAAIGDDLSGNTNDWTANNLAASDVVPDSPTNNFATMNELQVQGPSQTAPYALSEGSLKMTSTANNYAQMSGAMGVQGGKWYTETYINSEGYPSWYIGWIARDRLTTFTGSADFDGVTTGLGYFTGSNVYILDFGETSNVTTQVAYSGLHTAGDAPTTGDIIGCAVDFDNRKVWWSINGEWVDVGSGAGDPANGTNPTSTYTSSDVSDDAYKFAWQLGYGTTTKTINFGQDSTFAGATTAGGNSDENGYGDFKYTVPSGFLALCSANLPEPEIGPNSTTTSDENFNTVLWSGNSTNNRSITTDHATDFVWIKKRGTTVQSHVLADSVRGTSDSGGTGNVGILSSNLTNAESTNSSDSGIASFDSTGFTIGAGSNTANADAPYQGTNASSHTYVGWSWKAGGTAVSNEDGSITSSVSANQDAGFSVVSYSGVNTTTGQTSTIGHGLLSAPELIICKRRNSAQSWSVGSTAIGNFTTSDVFSLDTTGAPDTTWADEWGANPTNTVFTTGYSNRTNISGGTFIAYCFHSVEGFSKVGNYIANNSADGPFVYTGFRPAWVMIKNTDNASVAWLILDNKRSPSNVMNDFLYPNTTNAETNSTVLFADFLSNGFKIRNGTYGETNAASGNSFIYLAFAEAPFKYANAR